MNTSLIDSLNNDAAWQEFLLQKSATYIPEKVIERYKNYVENKEYADVATKVIDGSYKFSTPKKSLISKGGTSKKRTVYSYTKDETYILKMVSFLLYKYDYLFSDNLYSFRKKTGVRQAIHTVLKNKVKSKYAYKVDIKNYFNSINISKILASLEKDLNDEKLFKLIKELLENPNVIFRDSVVEEQKGAMAGVPISAFLANYYLKDLDFYFYSNNILYLRYADDIIVFDTEENIKKHSEFIKNFLFKNDLEVNLEKEFYYAPGDKINFLGFSFEDGTIDLSENSVKKIKGKIRRSARSFRRWMLKKQASPEGTLKAMNRKFNKKFFGKSESDLTWKYWFFPIINTTKSLKEIDNYLQDWERYVVTGVHNKKNYEKVTYDFLKKCNYKSLVHEYYERLVKLAS